CSPSTRPWLAPPAKARSPARNDVQAAPQLRGADLSGDTLSRFARGRAIRGADRPGRGLAGRPGGSRDALDPGGVDDARGPGGERVTSAGTHVRRDDAPSVSPVQRPRPPLWIAVYGTTSQRLAARLADAAALVGDEGLALEETLPRFRDRMQRLDEICAAEGR